jgi:signal transduction histidine kinase
LGECLAIAQQSIEKIREISFDLSPLMLESGSLPDTVRYYLDHQSQRHGLAVDFIASSSWTPLPREIEGACLRVVQEALGNVIQHASASRVQVELRQDAETAELRIRDDGVGFAPASLSQPGDHSRTLGLTAMRQRIELLGGTWHVESAPGQGTVIRAILPLADASTSVHRG